MAASTGIIHLSASNFHNKMDTCPHRT